jgi:hypothetical protein
VQQQLLMRATVQEQLEAENMALAERIRTLIAVIAELTHEAHAD